MESWWRLGEEIGHSGEDLAIYQIICPFCSERGNFKTVSHFEKRKANADKKRNFDTLKCGNCKAYVLCLWSAGRQMHDYRVLPWPRRVYRHPEHWPDGVGRFWVQAKRSLAGENWDAASVMARSALQAALRDQNAAGATLKQEIEDLAAKGLLPPIMKNWSDAVRELGNESAHPEREQEPTRPQDAADIIQFLDFLLRYLYDLPHQIKEYQERSAER